MKHGLHSVPVVANHLCILNNGDETVYRLESPHQDKMCSAAAGVCKCRVVSQAKPIVYVGDGRSDFWLMGDRVFCGWAIEFDLLVR